MPTPTVLYSARLFTGGADLTTFNNKIAILAGRESKDVTTFLPEDDPDVGWKKVIGGLASASIAASGHWEAGDAGKLDDVAWAQLGGQSAWTACRKSTSVGSLAWLMRGVEGTYQLLGQVGEVAPWSLETASSWPAVRGVVGHPPATARTATGTGTAVEVGAVSATQNLYAALHVLSVAGTSTPTITVKIASDVDGTFASPTDQLTFTAATAVGGQITRVPGAIADTFYRVAWTISGSSPSFLFLVSLGIF